MDRKTLGAVLAIGVGLASLLVTVGCSEDAPPTAPTIIVNGGNSSAVQIIGGGASPAPGAPGGCPVVDSTGVSAGLPGGNNNITQFRVGETALLNTTPKDAAHNPVDSRCHGSTVAWSLSGSASCQLLGETSGFNPSLRCSTAGSITVSAAVSAPGATGSATFTVTQ